MRLNLLQATKFYSAITNFDKVVSYYERLVTFDLKAHCTDFIAKCEWPHNSLDLNPLDYCV